MASLNKVMLIGNLGRDPELRYTASGQPVATFTLATNEAWTNRNGEREERTEWHRIVAWGKLAERCSEYLSKGRQVYVEGRLQTREWEDKEGGKRRTTEINAQQLLMLGRREGGPGPDVDAPPPPDPAGRSGGEAGGDDDIPF